MIKGWLFGVEKIVLQLTESPHFMQDALNKSVSRMALRLLARVKTDKLSGQVLKVRTGRLRRSINQRVVREGKGVYGYVGTNVEYGRAHEFGFKGAVSVRAQLREVKQAFGKPLQDAKSVFVQSHSHKVTLPRRSFLRSALLEMDREIKVEMCNAIHSALPIGKLLE